MKRLLAVGLLSLAGCGNGLPWLTGGLIIEDLLDQGPTDGEDGLDCWDSNANGECDEEEDWTGPEGEADGLCDMWDCRGVSGVPGEPGVRGPAGSPGPQGEPGETTVIIVEVEDDSPGHNGHAWGSDGPNGNQEKP